MKELEILNKIKASYQKILKDNLVGIYIHGSIAFKCFNWDKSDIDFLTVVSHAPSLHYLDSIKYDIENAVNEMDENPVYIILNLCRVLAYIRDGVVLSKEQGGIWGVKNLPETYGTVITDAKNSYCGNHPFTIDTEAKHCFAEYMLPLIFAK